MVSTKSLDLLIVSPLLRGSNPYPYGSLTYRIFILFSFLILIPFINIVNIFYANKKIFVNRAAENPYKPRSEGKLKRSGRVSCAVPKDVALKRTSHRDFKKNKIL